MTVVVAEDGHGASTDSEKRRHVTSAPRQLGLMYALPHLREAHRSLSALAVSSGRGLPPNESELPGRSQVRLRCGTRRPLIAPQPLRTLAVDRPALLEQQLVRPGGPPPALPHHAASGQVSKPGPGTSSVRGKLATGVAGRQLLRVSESKASSFKSRSRLSSALRSVATNVRASGASVSDLDLNKVAAPSSLARLTRR